MSLHIKWHADTNGLIPIMLKSELYLIDIYVIWSVYLNGSWDKKHTIKLIQKVSIHFQQVNEQNKSFIWIILKLENIIKIKSKIGLALWKILKIMWKIIGPRIVLKEHFKLCHSQDGYELNENILSLFSYMIKFANHHFTTSIHQWNK
jgi:hypothetical protein